MYRRLAIPGIIFLLMALASTSWAKLIIRVGAEAQKDGTACVFVNGRQAIHLMTYNGKLSPSQRAKIASDRLITLVQKGLDPKALYAKPSGKSVRIMAGDSMVLVATAAEARAHKTPAESLAASWIANLQKLLSMPALSANPTSVVVPVGESRTVAVESLLTSPVTAEVSDASLIFAEGKPGMLIIHGKALGNAVATIKCEGRSVAINVSVRKYAATLTPGSIAIVTGWDAPASLVILAARDAARRSVLLEPGASIRALDAGCRISDLEPTKVAQIPMKIEAAGDGYLPAKLTANVQVENQPLPRVPASWIMYSNEPERVEKYQILFTGRIDSAEHAIRLLYHHQNMMGKRVGFAIDVLNPSSTPASLHVVEGVSKPMVDTVTVGYKAGLEFMENHRSFIGRVMDLPPGTRRLLVSQALDSSYTTSGILELRQISGEPLLVRVIAKPEEQRLSEDRIETVIPMGDMDLAKIAISDYIYPEPVMNLEVKYTAGKPWVFLRLGKEGLKHASLDKQLYGNYGVIYEIKATLENPTSDPLTAELAFEATAGPASGVFLVDGNLVRVKSLSPPSEICIGKVTVPAGKSKVVSIRTIPLSGSAYPATLIIRPVGMVGSVNARG